MGRVQAALDPISDVSRRFWATSSREGVSQVFRQIGDRREDDIGFARQLRLRRRSCENADGRGATGRASSNNDDVHGRGPVRAQVEATLSEWLTPARDFAFPIINQIPPFRRQMIDTMMGLRRNAFLTNPQLLTSVDFARFSKG